MEKDEFINVITKLVIEQMGAEVKAETGPLILVLGDDCQMSRDAISTVTGRLEFYNTVNFLARLDGYDRIVAPYLSARNMANIANGIGVNPFEKALLDCVMRNKRVEVCIFQLSGLTDCNPSYYKMLTQYKSRLEEFGVVECLNEGAVQCEMPEVTAAPAAAKAVDLTARKTITEPDLFGAAINGTILISKARRVIFTPSARDVIREKRLSVIEQ